MRIMLASVIVCWLLVAACAASLSAQPVSNPASPPETVLITYHVVSGKEAELQQTLSNVWDVYQREHLVLAEPHVIVRDKDGTDKTRFVEVFTWVSHDAPEHVPDSVTKLWGQMQACCEKRDGHPGIDGGEVELLVPGTAGK